MRYNSGLKEETEGIKYWVPGTGILAALVLVALVILLLGLAFFSNAYVNGSLQENQQTSGSGASGSSWKDREEALKAQAADLDAREGALQQRENALNELEDVKSGILQELSERLAGRNIAVEIDEAKCSVRFSELALFNVNEYTINASGEEYLKQFLTEYFSVLLSEENRKHIEQIIIEGHADEDGTFEYNLKLSQNRATTVTDIILSQNYLTAADGTDEKMLLAISGRSSSEPIMVNNTVDRDKSRRVEFIFRLKSGDPLKQGQ